MQKQCKKRIKQMQQIFKEQDAPIKECYIL